MHCVRDFTCDGSRCRTHVRNLPRSLACLTGAAIAVVRRDGRSAACPRPAATGRHAPGRRSARPWSRPAPDPTARAACGTRRQTARGAQACPKPRKPPRQTPAPPGPAVETGPPMAPTAPATPARRHVRLPNPKMKWSCGSPSVSSRTWRPRASRDRLPAAPDAALCQTVWRETPRRRTTSRRGTNPSGGERAGRQPWACPGKTDRLDVPLRHRPSAQVKLLGHARRRERVSGP